MTTLFGMELTQRELQRHTGRLDQVGGITVSELTEGRARGLRQLQIATAAGLRVTSLAGRSLDLAHAEYRGIPLCWRSPNGDAVPAFYDPDGQCWLRTFMGGLVTTCGLTNFGPGGTDQYGTVGLHDRIDCLPAEDVRWAENWDGDRCVLEVSGVTRQTRVFGENLSLRRRLWTELSSASIRLHDTVTNDGFSPAPHMILYHCNNGFPLLAEDACLYVSHRGVRPRDAEAEKGLEVWNQVTAPQPGFQEQVFIHQPIPCADGRAAVALVNERLGDTGGLGLAIRFDPAQLSALFTWRMLGEGTYVMGMEPANCSTIEGRAEAIKRGTLPLLQPGKSREYELEFRVLRNCEEIGEMLALINEANAGAAC